MNFSELADNINIVLVQPKRAANIGAAARAINCMGLSNLILVEPRCNLDKDAYNLAVGSEHILDGAKIYSTLKEAVSGSSLIVGTTKRCGKRRHNFVSARNFVNDIIPLHQGAKISILFGPEDYGLSSLHIKECQYLIYIPVNKDFGSLNLSQAVMVVAYEINASLGNYRHKSKKESLGEAASPEDLELLSRILSKSVEITKFPERLMASSTSGRLMEIISRAGITKYEHKLILGLARHAEYMSRKIEERESVD